MKGNWKLFPACVWLTEFWLPVPNVHLWRTHLRIVIFPTQRKVVKTRACCDHLRHSQSPPHTRARTHTHRAHLTRHGYPKQQEQLICCSLACLAVISLALFTHTHSLPLSVKHTRAVSESLHTQTREWMLWGLISVLRGLAATSQAHIPGVEATETNLCDQSAEEHRLYTAGDDLWNTGGLRAAPTMSTYAGCDGLQRRQPLEEREDERNKKSQSRLRLRGHGAQAGTHCQLRLSG